VTEQRGRPDANACFVCGPDNPQGLRVAFRLDGDVCRAAFTPGPWHAGYDNQSHGGIIYSLLDDVMANWLFMRGERAHTAKSEIRYRQPVPLGTALSLEGWLVKRKGRLAVLRGEARREDDGQLVAEAEATFMVIPDAG